MNSRGLSWRIGLPFLSLVLLATGTVVGFMRWQNVDRDRAQLRELAAAHAAFIGQASLPPSERLAADLRRVTGFDVYFLGAAGLVPAVGDPALADQLAASQPDGAVHEAAGHQLAGVALPSGAALWIVRPTGAWLDARIVQVVASFWALALLLSVLVVRWLVRPLRNLAAQLPRIEGADDLIVPEVDRRDEIGDVARSLVATHRRLREERELRERAEKLAVLGRMTASLAHEIQNPVAAIKMHAQLWGQRHADAPIDVVVGEAARIEALLNQWLFLTRPEPPAFGDGDLALLLRDLQRAQAARLQHASVSVRIDAPDRLPLECDRARLSHVFGNLMTNAMQAMADGGELQVRAAVESDRAVVTFEDEGPGFSAEALRRLPQFFYSEKEGGMGIGLAVASGIVAAHGGALALDNVGPDGGARVRVTLPLRQGNRRER